MRSTLLFCSLLFFVALLPWVRADCEDPDEDTNFEGFDIADSAKKVDDWFTCCQVCSDIAACQGWTWNSDNGMCYPKSSTEGATAGPNMLSGRIVIYTQAVAEEAQAVAEGDVAAEAIDDSLELVGDEAAQAVTDVAQEFTAEELAAMAVDDTPQLLEEEVAQAVVEEEVAQAVADETPQLVSEEIQALADETPEFTAEELEAMAVEDTAEYLGDDELQALSDELLAMAIDEEAEFFGDEAHAADDFFLYGDEAQADASGTYQGAQDSMGAVSAVAIFVAVVLFVSLFVIALAVYIIRQEKAPVELI